MRVLREREDESILHNPPSYIIFPLPQHTQFGSKCSVLSLPFLYERWVEGCCQALQCREKTSTVKQASTDMFQHSTDGRDVTMQWDVTALKKKTYKEMALLEQTG